MANNQITISPACERDDHVVEGSDEAVKEMGVCTACGIPMLSVSVQRHLLTACAMNPNRLRYQCHQCLTGFSRRDALKRHLAAACPESRRAATSTGSDMGPGFSCAIRSRITRRNRTTRQTVSYMPSSASKSSFGPSRRRRGSGYSAGPPVSTNSPAVSAPPPILSATCLVPIEELHGRARLSSMMNTNGYDGTPQHPSDLVSPSTQSAQSSARMGHNHFFDQLRAASLPPNTAPMGGLSQTNEVPPFGHCLPTPFGFYANDAPLEAVPGAHFSSNWDTSSLLGAFPANIVLIPHGVGFYDTSAGFASRGYSRAVTKTPQFTPVNDYYPPVIQGQAAFALQRSTHPQINYLGEQAVFHAQSSSGGPQYQSIP